MANDVIPFIITKSLLERLKKQITRENEKKQFEVLQNSLKNMLPDVMTRVYDRLEWQNDEELTQFVLEEFDKEANSRNINDIEYILNLSEKDFSNLRVAIDKYLQFNRQDIINAETAIEESLKNTQEIRAKMETSNIDGFQEFADKKNDLINRKNDELERQQAITSEYSSLRQELLDAEGILKREEKKFEDQVKARSVNDLAERSIAFLEKLQSKLYSAQVKKVEELFMSKIKQLARKNNFVDMINIDEEFNIHVYKKVVFNAHNTCRRNRPFKLYR